MSEGKSKQLSYSGVVRHAQTHILTKKGNKKRGERRGHQTTIERMNHLYGGGSPLTDQIRGKLEWLGGEGFREKGEKISQQKLVNLVNMFVKLQNNISIMHANKYLFSPALRNYKF